MTNNQTDESTSGIKQRRPIHFLLQIEREQRKDAEAGPNTGRVRVPHPVLAFEPKSSGDLLATAYPLCSLAIATVWRLDVDSLL